MTAPVIDVAHLGKTYGDRVAVADVSLTVHRGEIVGILGRNGAGKTTTVECLVGLRVPDSGTVRVLGLDPQVDAAAVHERVAIQLQESDLPPRIGVREALELYASFYDDPADPDALLADLGLAEHARQRVGRLSGGQRQRLSIALALVGDPEVAILDELTTGLDPQARRETWALVERVRARGVTILLVTHSMEEAERLCDRVVVIDAGRVVAMGTPAEVAARTGTESVLRFRATSATAPTAPGVPLPPGALDAALAAVPGVVATDGPDDAGEHAVRTTGDVVQDVLVALAAAGIRVGGLRLERASLEDAFVSLTGPRQEV